MKDLQKIINKPITFVILVSVGGFILIVGLVFYLVLPKFSEYSTISAENEKSQREIDAIERTISSFSKIDAESLEENYNALTQLIPADNDSIRFLALNEVVAKSSGISIVDARISAPVVTAPQRTPSQTTPANGSPSQPQSSSGIVKPANAQVPTNAQQSQGSSAPDNSYNLEITFEGNFNQILNYVVNMKNTDRLVGIQSLSIAKGDSSASNLVGLVKFILPLSSAEAAVTPAEPVEITEDELEFIENLKSKLNYTVSPSSSPTGKTNPFK